MALDMKDPEVQAALKAAALEVVNSVKADEAVKADVAKAEKEKTDAAVAAAKAEWEKEAAANNRLPSDRQAPYQTKFADTAKFDNLDIGDNALLIEVLTAGRASGQSKRGASPEAAKALALKLESDKLEDVYRVAHNALKATGLKANELNYSTQTSYGDEWVSQAWSTRLWESIRQETFVVDKLMERAVEIPQGAESLVMPLEGADMIWYKVAQATGVNATTGMPDATVTASKTGTDQKVLSAVKMGARGVWSGEMEEDSIIPWVANLRRQLTLGYAEQMEHAVIDGDTTLTASTNINNIAGTPAGNEVYTLVNGFRKSALVTTTANSRAGGVLGVDDYIETIKLMGLGGKNARNKDSVSFITDMWVPWTTLLLAEIKTRDVFSAPTIENGVLANLWGYKVYQSAFMHYANQDATYGLKANTSGKVDLNTASNNTTGSILSVRWDQWQLGIKRRLTIETQRIPQADATQIVAISRWGLAQRDTEASAISYGLTL